MADWELASEGNEIYKIDPLKQEEAMNPRVKAVEPANDYTLLITFMNNEKRIFDVKPYLDKGVFKELKNPALFKTVKPFQGSIQWVHEQDFCPDMLWEDGVPVQ